VHVVIFCHSLVSDWNHGNAHFLRGVASELLARGHSVKVLEPEDGWSREHLLREHGPQAIDGFERAYPALRSSQYHFETLDLDRELEGANLVLVHEWNEPALVAAVGRHRATSGDYQLLFHDTHHRSLTERDSMAQYCLTSYDGVLAFGEVIRRRYLEEGWAQRVWTWHEAADVRVFKPLRDAPPVGDLIWIGNWGDEERTAELEEFVIAPVQALRLQARVHGVRYPSSALRRLAEARITYAGWLPNYQVPATFGRFRVAVHIPRRPYVAALPGIPTIRVFEALACGIPLICAPWDDAEGLFTPGSDYLVARDGQEMHEHLGSVLADPDAASTMAARGLETILARHTCGHRVDELMRIMEELGEDDHSDPVRQVYPQRGQRAQERFRESSPRHVETQ
jgi:spore maturation protein CgeB